MGQRNMDEPDQLESSHQCYVNSSFVILEDTVADTSTTPAVDEKALSNLPSTIDRRILTVATEKETNDVRIEHGETDPAEAIDVKEDKPQGSPQIRRQVMCAVVAAFTHVLIGTIIGLPGVILPQLTDPTSHDLFLTTYQVALFGSLTYVGAMVGSLLTGPVCTHYGQRVTLLLAVPYYLVMWFGMYFASAVWALQLARALLGMTIGFIGSSSTTYLAEVTQPELRGRFISFQDVGRNAGVLMVYMIGSLDLTWREVILVCGCITTLPTIFGVFLLPNSPRWLVTRGREEEAYKALVYLRGPHHDSQAELRSIVDHFCETASRTSTMEQMKQMRQPNLLYRISLMTVLTVLFHFTGNIPIVTYGVSIFQATDSSMNSYTSAVSIVSLRLLGVVVLQAVVKCMGRKRLMVVANLVCAVSLLFIGIYFLLQNMGKDVSALGWIPLISLLVYMPFVVVIDALFSTLRSEVFPNSLRAMAASIMFGVFCLSMFAATQLFPIIVEAMGEHWAFWIFGISCFLMAVLITVLLPETQGLTLEEIDNTFRFGKKIQL